MDFCVAGEAEVKAAVTVNGRLIRNSYINLDSVGAVRRWTKLDEAVIGDETAGDELLVLWLQFLREHVIDKVIVNRHIALITGALDAVDQSALHDRCFDVLSQTIAAEEVTAVQFVNELKKRGV